MRPGARIAIAGAGVAGSAAAIGLARLGHQVTLFEAVALPEPIGAGLLLQPTGQQVSGHGAGGASSLGTRTEHGRLGRHEDRLALGAA